MAWIPSDTNMGRHPKTRRFARELSISVPTAMGHLHLFWHWCMDFASNGYVTKHDVIDIADAALWDDDPQRFMDALIKCHFIDEMKNELVVHDWEEYGGKLLEKKTSNAKRQAEHRERKKASPSKDLAKSNGDVTSESNAKYNGSNGDVTVMSHENNALEKSTVQKSTEEKSTSTSADADVVHAKEKPKKRSAEPSRNKSSSSASPNSEIYNLTPERQAMLDALLDTLDKKIDWYGGTLAPADKRIIAQILNKVDRDGRTLDDVNRYLSKFAEMLGRDISTVTVPTPQQMLRDFDRVYGWKKVQAKGAMTEDQQLARMAELRREREKVGVA